MACNKYEQEFSVTYPLNGRYIVTEMYDDSSTYGPYEIVLSNTAGNSKDSILITNIYDDGIRAKARVNGSDFAINLSPDYNPAPAHSYPFISIKNGNVTDNKMTVKLEVYLIDVDSTGALADTIDHLRISGKRATGFE